MKWQVLRFAALDNAELYSLLELRARVFVVEQASAYQDPDGKDQQALHMLGTADGTLLAYQRCLPPGISYPESSLGRIVVAPQARGRRLGAELVARGIEVNQREWPGSDICISAQAHLEPFYSTFGFIAEGEHYAEDGIPHRKMRLART